MKILNKVIIIVIALALIPVITNVISKSTNKVIKREFNIYNDVETMDAYDDFFDTLYNDWIINNYFEPELVDIGTTGSDIINNIKVSINEITTDPIPTDIFVFLEDYIKYGVSINVGSVDIPASFHHKVTFAYFKPDGDSWNYENAGYYYNPIDISITYDVVIPAVSKTIITMLSLIPLLFVVFIIIIPLTNKNNL